MSSSKESWLKPRNPENSKCPNEHLRLTTMQMKIQQESASGPITKVLEHLKCNNFSFGIFLSTMENLEKNRLESQPNIKITEFLNFSKVLSCSVVHISKLAQIWTKLQLSNL